MSDKELNKIRMLLAGLRNDSLQNLERISAITDLLTHVKGQDNEK